MDEQALATLIVGVVGVLGTLFAPILSSKLSDRDRDAAERRWRADHEMSRLASSQDVKRDAYSQILVALRAGSKIGLQEGNRRIAGEHRNSEEYDASRDQLSELRIKTQLIAPEEVVGGFQEVA